MNRIKPKQTTNARSLRTNMTDAERLLWRELRRGQLQAHRFRRQHPIGSFIVDFACINKKLIIELDGGQHQDQVTYDQKRTEFLQAQGWQVLRFWNNEVITNKEGVLTHVAQNLECNIEH